MDDVIERFGDVVHGFRSRLRDSSVLHEIGLPSFQARIIGFFARHPGGSPQVLASRTGRDKAQVARAIKELERRGLLTRQTDSADRRVARLFLSPAGWDLARQLQHQRDALAETMLAPLSSEERAALAAILAKMQAALGAGTPYSTGTSK